jgi:hypothetical protein
VALIDSLPQPLNGGPKLGRTWLDAETPARPAVWRRIRALRHAPPGRAGKGQRKEVFCSALEQAEQLFAAAQTVGDASRPILLFYGLSQAGRAIAAASTAADGNSYRLSGHGISVKNLGQGAALRDLVLADEERAGSFTQLSSMLRTGTLHDGAVLGDIWSTIPGLLDEQLSEAAVAFPPLRLEIHGMYSQEIHAWVHGMPKYLRQTEADPEQGLAQFLSHYPALAASSPSGLAADAVSPDDWQPDVTVRALRCWLWDGPRDGIWVPQFLQAFWVSRTQPYLGDDDRWVFPALGGASTPLHPLLAWWALLFTLSMLARYEPAAWTAVSALDVELDSPLAFVGRAADEVPRLGFGVGASWLQVSRLPAAWADRLGAGAAFRLRVSSDAPWMRQVIDYALSGQSRPAAIFSAGALGSFRSDGARSSPTPAATA